jgi:hypothetical protein
MQTRKVGTVLGAALTLLLSTATPASAHGADAPDATNYRTAITSAPSLPGVEIITIEAGARFQLTNNGTEPVEVLGYLGEPYVEIRPDGVYENIHSPATYLNITIAHVDPPATADPTLPPEWKKVSSTPLYRWHDQRALWTLVSEPPEVSAAPSAPHHLRDWVVPVRAGATAYELRGTLDWVPAPAPGIWWALAIAGVLAVGALGFLGSLKPVRAVITIVAGLLGLVYATAREVDAGFFALWPLLGQLLTAQLWTTVTSLAAIAAGIYALVKRRGDGDFAMALGAASVALFAGMANAAVFHRSIIPLPWDAVSGRTLVAGIIAFGGGSAVAAMLHLRGTAPVPDPDADTDGSDTGGGLDGDRGEAEGELEPVLGE